MVSNFLNFISLSYPKPGKSEVLKKLEKQLEIHKIPVVDTLPELKDFDFIIDAIFGYSFHPPVRGVFVDIISVCLNC